ncbi:hypothetical protein FNF28_06062 [Cafeteria roenbergensis]|uniref:Uncharacterized protein n=1 Tax=Cafeteria roenbergensis TaxID=33653 RepID=A0A5A8D2G6_CAFRO|nr:hypothetical protein FNF28_06062 [Cafeteria roenbergensis]
METAAKRRQDANELFRAGKHAEAAEAYGSAIAALAPVEASGAGGDAAVAVRTERATLLSNRAACHIRLGKFDAAIEDTTDALEIDGALVKARYRRAQAFHGKGRGMRAVMDLQEVLSVDPGNAGAKALLAKLLDEGKRGAAKQPAAVEAAEGLVAALKGSDKEVPDEAGRLMALAEVAAGAQEPRLAALSLCSEEDLARASGSRAVQLLVAEPEEAPEDRSAHRMG